jgi:hypothetical protein
MLLRRDADGDRQRATELVAAARATYRDLGMQDGLVRAERLARSAARRVSGS